MTSVVLSRGPMIQDSAFQLLSNLLLPAPVFLEVLGNGAWNPFLDCRALSWGQVYVPAGFELIPLLGRFYSITLAFDTS